MILKPEKQIPTSDDMNIKKEYQGIAYDLVVDGVIQYDNLKKLNKDYKWLKKQINGFGYEPESALIVTIDGNNNIFFQEKDDVK